MNSGKKQLIIMRIIDVVFFTLLLLLALYLVGCIPFVQQPSNLPVIDNPTTQTIISTIKSTDWLFSGFLVIIFFGLAAGLNGMKSGFLVSLAALVSLSLKAALSVVWVYWALALLALAGGLLVALSVLVKNKAIREFIANIQKIKTITDDVPEAIHIKKVPTRVRAVLEEQSVETKKIVKKVKNEQTKLNN